MKGKRKKKGKKIGTSYFCSTLKYPKGTRQDLGESDMGTLVVALVNRQESVILEFYSRITEDGQIQEKATLPSYL